jgi:serine phosphatase RsbU (regulator of sigma subunit)
LLLAVVCLLATPKTPAQVDATQWRNGTVNLNEGWREHDGDDPAWAQPEFNDSRWQTVEIDDLGAAAAGTRWFRLHVKLEQDHGHLHLLLAGGEGTYELYVNGQRQDEPGLSHVFGVYRPTEQVFSLTEEDTDTDLVLALRTSPPQIYRVAHLPLFLTAAVGTPKAIEILREAMEQDRLYAVTPAIAFNLVLVLAGIGTLALYRSQRRREYLWLGLYLLALGISNGFSDCSSDGVIPLAWNDFVADPLIYAFTILQIEFTFSFAGQRVTRAWRTYEWLLPAPLILSALMLGGRIVSSDPYALMEAAVILPAALLLPVLLFVWYRRGNREAGWLILPSLLPAAATALFDVGFVSIYQGWTRTAFLDDSIMVGPIPIQLADLGDFLFLLAIGVVMFFRFTRVSREQGRVAAELAAARDIQRRLVPETLPELEGYEIEAAYFPAEEVGGDFYQVLQTDDAALVVVGDVSGKGLKAAMTSTQALGALRALATEGLGPGALLARLNRQLAETGHEGFVTCLCARLSAEGEVTVANAGHLPPYRNGEEVLLEPDLPLGLAPDTKYVEQVFRMDGGDRLTVLSDGVVEARDARGELFGFERTRAISTQPANAIAEAALGYGQADDITVLTLRRTSGEMLTTRAQPAAVVIRE